MTRRLIRKLWRSGQFHHRTRRDSVSRSVHRANSASKECARDRGSGTQSCRVGAVCDQPSIPEESRITSQSICYDDQETPMLPFITTPVTTAVMEWINADVERRVCWLQRAEQ